MPVITEAKPEVKRRLDQWIAVAGSLATLTVGSRLLALEWLASRPMDSAEIADALGFPEACIAHELSTLKVNRLISYTAGAYHISPKGRAIVAALAPLIA